MTGKNSAVRKILRVLVIVPLVAGGLAIAQPAQAAPYYTTTPPEGCYVYRYVHRGFTFASQTYCTRMHGLHRAVARCADGRVVYGYTEEMDFMRMSTAECRAHAYPNDPVPAVEWWGEFWSDY